MNELTVEQDTILFFTKVLENYPGKSIELVQEAYIDACLEINMMSEAEKQACVNEKIEMMNKLKEPDGNQNN